MWTEELTLENIRCFDKIALRFSKKGDKKGEPYKWITLLGENGGGKSTTVQALALLLAGPEGAQQLLSRPIGWLRNEEQTGKISIRIHKGSNDPGQLGDKKITSVFGYTYFITGSKPLTIRKKQYTEPSIVENKERLLTWLRQNALTSKGKGWFAVGYGAFRRLTRSSQIIVPSLEPQARFSNFITQFDEDQPLVAFERWMVYLDYRIAKGNDNEAKRQKELGITAINKVLPDHVSFDSVTSEGRILFNIGGGKVPTIALSDGYRSVLALAGDIVWRLLMAFPESDDPLKEEGVVLIDELDIHLHPVWQRDIALWLQEQFPNIQFIVATHSPLVASGAGPDALTYRFFFKEKEDKASVEQVEDIAAMNVDRILKSTAFGLVSPYSPQTQAKLDKYDTLARKRTPTEKEKQEMQLLLPFMKTARPFGGPPQPGSLDSKIDQYLDKKLS